MREMTANQLKFLWGQAHSFLVAYRSRHPTRGLPIIHDIKVTFTRVLLTIVWAQDRETLSLPINYFSDNGFDAEKFKSMSSQVYNACIVREAEVIE